jgi:putative FmdB family regulatory protein
MPLYEYQCDSCAHRFELIQKFSDPPVAACPACGGAVRKLPSSPAIQFKGAGWYITDYARKGQKDSAGSTPGESTEPAKSSPSTDSAESGSPAPAAAGSTSKQS